MGVRGGVCVNGVIVFVYSSNGPVVEAVCEAEGVGPDCLQVPSGGQWVKQVVGAMQGSPVMALVFLRQEELAAPEATEGS